MRKFLLYARAKLIGISPALISIVVLMVISAIPLVYSWGNINIGYDTFLPFSPEHSFKNAFQWTDRFNGVYTLNSYFIWVSSLYFFQLLGLNWYHASSLLQFFIFFLSGLGVYRIFTLYNKESLYLGLIPSIFYIYSPHMLDFMLYQCGTVGIVWSIYYFLKFIKYKILTFKDAIAICVAFATIADLPNPKYHFLLVLTFTLMLILAGSLRLISWQDVKKNTKNFLSLIVLSSYLLFPLITFGYSFARYNEVPINIKKDYSSSGETLDYGVAQIHKMIRLFHTPGLNWEAINKIETPIFFITYYILPILVLGIFPFILLRQKEKEKKQYFILYFFALFFIFISKGANPPFGIFYEMFLFSQLLSFLRTTAGFVVFAGVFYAIILGLIFKHAFKSPNFRIPITLLFTFLFTIWCYPIWSGQFFINRNEKTPGKVSHGMSVPKEYFQAADSISKRQLDAKIDIYPAQEGYQYNTWGYYGIVFYPWLLKQPSISFPKTTHEGREQSLVNVKYLLHDKSALQQETFIKPETKPLYESKYLDIYELPVAKFIPHIYVPAQTFATNRIPNTYLNRQEKTSLLGFFSLTNKPDVLLSVPKTIVHRPVIEYRKIDPTKYRILIHGASEVFPLIFLENFHPFWKLYITKPHKFTNESNYPNLNKIVDDRATQNDIKLYVKNGSVTHVGSGYISKILFGTIQNNNLPTDNFLETLFLRSSDSEHLKVNGFFNAWLVEPNQLCNGTEFCIENEDKSYEMEFILEFWPQKIANLSMLLSISAVVFYLIYAFGGYIIRNRKQ